MLRKRLDEACTSIVWLELALALVMVVLLRLDLLLLELESLLSGTARWMSLRRPLPSHEAPRLRICRGTWKVEDQRLDC